jgi:2-polyprenyl-6-methoxyphenol hydroxylase-like FAD-dependent oxidoreductase
MGFRDFELGASGAVRIQFDDGSSSTWFDVLVGADGVNSAVRARRLPQAVPADTGSICMYGKTDISVTTCQQVADELQDGTSVIFADGFAAVIDAMRFRRSAAALATEKSRDWRLSHVEDYLYWAFIGPRARFGIDQAAVVGIERDAIRQAIERVTRDWAPALRALFELAGEEGRSSTVVRSAVAMDAWETNGVVLLGDAIHAMSPAGGLGANTALADASELARLLVDVSAGERSILDAVRAYEVDMRRRAQSALQISEEGARRLFSR